jgi:hypothetical protein
MLDSTRVTSWLCCPKAQPRALVPERGEPITNIGFSQTVKSIVNFEHSASLRRWQMRLDVCVWRQLSGPENITHPLRLLSPAYSLALVFRTGKREIPEVAPFTATAGQERNASGAGKLITLGVDSDQAKQPLYCNLKLMGLVAD